MTQPFSRLAGLGRLPARQETTVARIVDCLAPTYPALEPATRSRVLGDVTAFVGSQIRSIPDVLRYPYLVALEGFEWLALLRWGRRFSELDIARRAAWVDLWTGSPLAPMRNFVKLIRGCALLAYYDHPESLAVLEAQRSPRASRDGGDAVLRDVHEVHGSTTGGETIA